MAPDGIPQLDPVALRALCDRLGARRGLSLTDLQRRWSFALPFHNVELLADGEHAPVSTEVALERCVMGIGGPCHVHAVGFCALLRALGHDACLTAATIGTIDDHLLVRVENGGGFALCDVGNGHPYLEPFPQDQTKDLAHLGWHFQARWEQGILSLQRLAPDEPRLVYQCDGQPRTFAELANNIHRHHTEPSFGPFLRGLRAVSMGPATMWTLRDRTLTCYSGTSVHQEHVDDHELVSVLRQRFGLGALPLERAVEQWREARR